MKNYWVPAKSKLYGIPAIEHTITKETVICSKYGEIWAYSSGVAAVLVRDRKCASRVARFLGPRTLVSVIVEGEEALFKVTEAQVSEVVRILNIPKRRAKMLQYANS